MIEVVVGTATVKVEADEARNGIGVVSQAYDVDALLHAVQRACEATLSCDGVQTTLSDLRRHLLAHQGKTCPGAVVHVDDPIETDRQAALGQWRERWRQLQVTGDGSVRRLLLEVAQRVPVGPE